MASLRQAYNTVTQLMHCDSVHASTALARYGIWQFLRATQATPKIVQLSNSILDVSDTGSQGCLVYCMDMYDFNNMSLIRLLMLGLNTDFVDVGANIGTYTLFASELPEARIRGFEAHPKTYAKLLHNIRINERDNITTENVAISDQCGYVRFTDHRESTLNQIAEGAGDDTFMIKSRTLDEVLAGEDKRPVIVKIDVEGFELQVLNGFRKYSSAALALFVENGDRQEIIDTALAMGFRGPLYYHARRRAFYRTRQARPEDSVFLKPEAVDYLKTSGIVFDES